MADFETVRRDWIRLAELDPLWAVYVAPDTRGGRWDVAEFFHLGRVDVAAALARLERLGLPTRFERVLDFGCGVGRLSQALAEHAESVIGVDVAPPMIELARELNPSPRCDFVLNDAPDLRAFPDAGVDLVFSELVLQHLPRPLIDTYLAEFLRVLRPGGIALVQIPDRPLWTVKGAIWRLVPGRLVRYGQRVFLRYPAPMRMTGVRPAHVRALVTRHGGTVLDVTGTADRAAHWRSMRYVIRRLPTI